MLACVRRWVRVAWVCRVSVTSCLAGIILLVLVAQARDLFLDFPGSTNNVDTWYEGLPSMIWYAFYFGLLVLVFWALPVHATARLGLDRSEWLESPCGPSSNPASLPNARANFATAVELFPRILGALCFVGAAVGASYTGYELLFVPSRDTNPAAATALILYVLSLAGFCGLFLWYSSQRRRWFNTALQSIRRANRPLEVPASPSVAGSPGDAGILGTFDLWIVTALFVFLVFVLAVPSFLNAYFPRLFLIPVLLGAWVPVLGWFGRWSFATKVPLITAAILVIAIFSYFVGDNHDVTVTKGAYNGQIGLAEAVSRWKQANDCGRDKQPCPSPIIVASAGGADRAAYMTASALGLLLDATCFDEEHLKPAGNQPQVSRGCKQPPLFGRRLFAISSVSGGSLGAVVYARSYRDGTNDAKSEYKPPCQAKDFSRLWFGHGGPRNWRDCLQEILAEDFLSPVFAGLGFRDVFSSFGKLVNMKFPDAWRDRGQLLEKSWIDAYNKYVETPKGSSNSPSGLEAPFTSLQPGDSQGSDWNPLLLLNATSVDTGRRIITSHIAPTYASSGSCAKDRKPEQPSCVRLFTDAYDMHELLNGTAVPNGPACGQQEYQANKNHGDLSLAAAAGNSARFPVVSPAGNLLPPDGAKLVGRIADGGYFDNYGALTAFNLVDTLRWEYDLYPFVILITNDPGDNDDPTLSKGSTAGPSSRPPAGIKASKHLFASVVAAPVDTFFNVRSGHGSTALKLLRELIDPSVYQKQLCGGDQNEATAKGATKPVDQTPRSCYDLATTNNTDADQTPREPCFAHLGVYPQETEAGTVKNISMSWWLSKPVQDYLDSQIKKPWFDFKNRENLMALELVCKIITLGLQEGPAGSRSPLEACRSYINPPDKP